MLLNYPSLFLNTYDSDNPQKIITYDSDKHLIDRDIDYFFFQISSADSIEIFLLDTLISSNDIEKIRNKEYHIVLDNSDECFYDIIDSIYKNIVDKFNIPAEQITLISGGPRIIDRVRQLGFPPINIEWASACELSIKQSYPYQYSQHLNTLEHKEYSKKFLLFNRRWRPWRPMLITLLYDRGLLDHGYVSLGQSDTLDNWNNIYNNLYHLFDFKDVLDKNKSIKSLPPMYLDTNDLVTNRVGLSNTTDSYFENSYFSVITETTYFNNQPIFPTEKIFKAIAMRHPFILVTVPGTLKFLREQGYKTFEGIINESYDSEYNDSNRLILIVNEIQRLCKLNTTELDQFLNYAKGICEFNFSHLMNQQSFIRKCY